MSVAMWLVVVVVITTTTPLLSQPRTELSLSLRTESPSHLRMDPPSPEMMEVMRRRDAPVKENKYKRIMKLRMRFTTRRRARNQFMMRRRGRVLKNRIINSVTVGKVKSALRKRKLFK